MDLLEEITKMIPDQQRIQEQGYDNLFSANHRNGMIERYGYTQAMTVTIPELIEQWRTNEPSRRLKALSAMRKI
jgi:hypothetical protein